MKKLICCFLTLGICFSAFTLSAQDDQVQRAYKLSQNKEHDNARKCIDSAIADSRFKNEGETWYIRARIFKAIYSEKEKSKKDSPSRIVALDSYKKCIELNNNSHATDESKKAIENLNQSLYNDAVRSLNQTEYAVADRNYSSFKKYFSIYNSSQKELSEYDVKFLLPLANVYADMFESATNTNNRSEYYEMALKYFDDVLKVSDNANAKLDRATFIANANALQADEDTKGLKKDINAKSSKINMLDKDNQQKQMEITQKQEEIQKKEIENAAINRENEMNKKEKELKDIEIAQQSKIRNIFICGFILMLLFSVVIFNRFKVTAKQKKIIEHEKQRSEDLLLNILPSEVAEELKKTGFAKAKSFDMVTVLFTDFKDFTKASEKYNAEELVGEINLIYSEFDKIISGHNIEKIKTIGDSYMCAGGLPVANVSNAIECVRAAIEINEFNEKHKAKNAKLNKPHFDIRIGLHTGSVVAGIVGIKKFAYDIWGDTVNIASRMESSGEPGKINISGTTYEIVKNDFHCTHRGKILAKNKGEIDMYFVERKE